MKKVVLRESQAPYTLAIDDETLAEEPVIVEQNGRPVAALVPIAEYEAFRAWQQGEEPQQPALMDAFDRERATFERLKPELLRTHAGEVVAIYQGKVVETGTDIADTLDNVYDRFGYVACYVQRVEDVPRIYKFPHRTVVG